MSLFSDLARFVAFTCRSRRNLAAENLFLRKQLACYVERQAKPRRADNATRITLVVLARYVYWRRLLTLVRPDTFMRWHRRGYRLFWQWNQIRVVGRAFQWSSSA
jgi:putative transposase